MPGENIQDWSTSATLNGNADSSIGWAEGQARASVNNSARSMMAAHAKDRNLKNGSIVTSGAANAQTFFSGLDYTSVPTGLRATLKIGPALTNTGATTLNMDNIGAVAIKNTLGNELAASVLTAGTYIDVIYDGTVWVLLHFRPDLAPVAVSPAPPVIDGVPSTGGSGSSTVTNITTLDFNEMTSQFHYYQAVISGLTPEILNSFLLMRFSIDNGVTFISTASYNQLHIAHGSIAGSGNAQISSIPSETQLLLTNVLDTALPLPGQVIVDIFGMGKIGAPYVMVRSTSYHTTNGNYFFQMQGNNVNISNANAIRFFMSSGKIATGTFALYGFRA